MSARPRAHGVRRRCRRHPGRESRAHLWSPGSGCVRRAPHRRARGRANGGSPFDGGGVPNTVALSNPASTPRLARASACRRSTCPSCRRPLCSLHSTLRAPRRARMITKRRAARLIPPMIATGVARISGHGVATTRMASARIQSCVSHTAMPQTATVIGVNHTAYRSASR